MTTTCKICKKEFKSNNINEVYCKDCCKKISKSNKIICNKININKVKIYGNRNI